MMQPCVSVGLGSGIVSAHTANEAEISVLCSVCTLGSAWSHSTSLLGISAQASALTDTGEGWKPERERRKEKQREREELREII